MLSTPTLIFTHLDSLFSWQKSKENRSSGEWELNSLTWGANSSRPIFAFLSSYPCLLWATLCASLGAVCSHSAGPNGLDMGAENRSSVWTRACSSSCRSGRGVKCWLKTERHQMKDATEMPSFVWDEPRWWLIFQVLTSLLEEHPPTPPSPAALSLCRASQAR